MFPQPITATRKYQNRSESLGKKVKNYDVYIDHIKALKITISILTVEKLQKSSLETDRVLCNIQMQFSLRFPHPPSIS